MKRTLLILMLGMFLVSFSSAIFEVSKELPSLKEDLKLQISESADKYPAISIEDNLGLPLVSNKKADLVLTEHQESCEIDCFSEFTIVTYQDSALIDDVKFYTLSNDGIEYDTPLEQPIRSYQFYYWGNIVDYETQCINGETIISENGTEYTPQECSQIEIGNHDDWITYNIGTEMPEGNYQMKLTGQKRPTRSVDWIFETQGKYLEEWATWGNISTGSQAEVRLNSPTNGATAYSNPVTFNASANVTGGAYLTNMSFCSDISGSWGCGDSVEFTAISGDSLVSYYKLDETSGTTAFDSLFLNNGTNNAMTINQVGKIDKAYLSDNTNSISLPSGQLPTSYWDNNFSFSTWINPSNTVDSKYILWGGTRDISLQFTSNKASLVIWDGSANRIDSNDNIPTSEWTHLVVTRDKTNGLKMYVNGVLQTDTDAFTGNANAGGNTETYLGLRPSTGGMSGLLDEVGFWNKTLTSNEITILYNSGAGERPTDPINSSTQTWTKTIPTGTTKWNIEACDSDGDCGFATSNYTVNLDATIPVITMVSGNGTQNYGSITKSYFKLYNNR